MIERGHRHPCPPLRLLAAQGNGADPLLLYTFPVSTGVSSNSAAKSVCLASGCLNLGAARGGYFRVRSACGRMLVIYGGASCVRDLGRGERPRADEEEQTAKEDSALVPTAWNMQHLAQRAWHCVWRPSWGWGVALRFALGPSVIDLRTARDPSGVFDEELHLGARWTAGNVPKFRSNEAQTARWERCTTIVNSGIVDRKEATQGRESGLKAGDGARRPKPERRLPLQSTVDQWVTFVDSRSTLLSVLQLVKGTIDPYNKAHRLTSALTGTVLERHLPSHTFLVTERITLAGITLAADLQHAFTTTVDATLRAKLPNVLRHFETTVNQPNLTSIFGSTAFAEKALQYTHPPKEKKEKAPAASAEPKAEKKPKNEEVDHDDDEKPYEAPKEKNPLDLLPKSTLNLGDWKRYLLWCGFLEVSQKYLFGSVGVLGTTNNSIITGALIPRGQQEMRSVVEVAPDWEGYTYERIDWTTRSKRRSSRLRLHGTLKFSWGQEVGRREEFLSVLRWSILSLTPLLDLLSGWLFDGCVPSTPAPIWQVVNTLGELVGTPIPSERQYPDAIEPRGVLRSAYRCPRKRSRTGFPYIHRHALMNVIRIKSFVHTHERVMGIDNLLVPQYSPSSYALWKLLIISHHLEGSRYGAHSHAWPVTPPH
ncbi:hypothetical protein BC826DRAFT_1174519 [Russula brevipes]|nr:hypothetical protein BC826DRAFT_1174519 [Russula brevipes]